MLVPRHHFFTIEQALTQREVEIFPVTLGKDEAFMLTEVVYQHRGSDAHSYECGVLVKTPPSLNEDYIKANPDNIACVEGILAYTGFKSASLEQVVTSSVKIPFYIYMPGFTAGSDHFGVVITTYAQTVKLTDHQVVALNRRLGIAKAYHIFEEA